MWVAIVFLVILVPLGIVAIVSFFSGGITAKDLFAEVGKINPIPKISELNPALLILGAGGILVGIAAVVAANKGNAYTTPAGPSFAISNPALGSVAVNPPPAVIQPATRGRGP